MRKAPEAFRTISEAADALDTPAHVLRFWESKFSQVKPVKRAGGRRYYRPADIDLLSGIKLLLHDQGMTIRGVQRLLQEKGARHVAAMSPLGGDILDAVAATPITIDANGAEPSPTGPVAKEISLATATGAKRSDTHPTTEEDRVGARSAPPDDMQDISTPHPVAELADQNQSDNQPASKEDSATQQDAPVTAKVTQDIVTGPSVSDPTGPDAPDVAGMPAPARPEEKDHAPKESVSARATRETLSESASPPARSIRFAAIARALRTSPPVDPHAYKAVLTRLETLMQTMASRSD